MTEPPLGMVKQIERLERELAEAKVDVEQWRKDRNEAYEQGYHTAIGEAKREALAVSLETVALVIQGYNEGIEKAAKAVELLGDIGHSEAIAATIRALVKP